MGKDPGFLIIKDIIEQHLNIALKDVEYFDIIYSKLEKGNDNDVWRVNIEYCLKDDKDDNIKRVALFCVKGNEVTQFEQGKCWTC